MDQRYGQRGIVGPTFWSARYCWTNVMVNEVLRDYVDEIWIIHDLSAKVIVSRETCKKKRYIMMVLGKCIEFVRVLGNLLAKKVLKLGEYLWWGVNEVVRDYVYLDDR